MNKNYMKGENMTEDINLSSELLDEILKEAYKKGIEDAQEKKENQNKKNHNYL